MNKLDLIETLNTEAGVTQNEGMATAHLFIDEMADALASGDRVEKHH